MHQGMTSSDVLDTCFNVQLVRAADILIADVDGLLAALKRRAFEHKLTPTIGRSHGIHAEPTTFGLKLALCLCRIRRAQASGSSRARREVATCAISGAVGTFAQVDPRVEAHVADADGPRGRAGLDPDRSRATGTPCIFATLGVDRLLDRAARDRDPPPAAHRSARGRGISSRAGQKGSSAMPHKRNPVLSENLTGLARMVRAYVTPALENVALWHERDISHSSVERMIGPDATIDARLRAGAAGRRSSTSSSSIPRTCKRTSTGWAASSTRSACCSR